MNYILWILQFFLAAVFAWHGWLYAASSEPAFQAWHEKRHPGEPAALSSRFRKFIGICELLASVGLILPMFTGVLPWLTPLAAAGLIMVMIGSTVFHATRHEYSSAAISIVLVVLCAIVVYGRSPIVSA